MNEPLLIVGASARAASQSAVRAGFTPFAADMFGDVDLVATCPVQKLNHYPSQLLSQAAELPKHPLVYVGAIENHIQIVEHLALDRQLFGNPGHVLREVRNPEKVFQAFNDERIPCPQIACNQTLSPSTKWLRKPIRSSGGQHIERVTSTDLPFDHHFYFQEFIDGRPCSALFVAASGRSQILGMTEQFLDESNEPRNINSKFVYRGSFTNPNSELLPQLIRIGDILADRFQLVGLFGVDFIDHNGEVYPIEINPRYTATVEIIERATSIQAIAIHVDAFQHEVLPASMPPTNRAIIGKVIKYARDDFVVDETAVDFAKRQNNENEWPVYADIPQPATPINSGQPILSLLAAADSRQELEFKLNHAWKAIQDKL